MNVTWVIDEADGDEESSREKRFLKGAEAQGFRQIKGHRSVGGESFAKCPCDVLDNVA
jgi:phosphoserine aminotransferase